MGVAVAAPSKEWGWVWLLLRQVKNEGSAF
jgi:hypothetical protein